MAEGFSVVLFCIETRCDICKLVWLGNRCLTVGFRQRDCRKQLRSKRHVVSSKLQSQPLPSASFSADQSHCVTMAVVSASKWVKLQSKDWSMLKRYGARTIKLTRFRRLLTNYCNESLPAMSWKIEFTKKPAHNQISGRCLKLEQGRGQFFLSIDSFRGEQITCYIKEIEPLESHGSLNQCLKPYR